MQHGYKMTLWVKLAPLSTYSSLISDSSWILARYSTCTAQTLLIGRGWSTGSKGRQICETCRIWQGLVDVLENLVFAFAILFLKLGVEQFTQGRKLKFKMVNSLGILSMFCLLVLARFLGWNLITQLLLLFCRQIWLLQLLLPLLDLLLGLEEVFGRFGKFATALFRLRNVWIWRFVVLVSNLRPRERLWFSILHFGAHFTLTARFERLQSNLAWHLSCVSHAV